MPDIGLIGVGLLGSAIAERLLGAGFAVHGFDTDLNRLHWLAGQGGAAEDNAAAAARYPRLILCLPDSRISARVVESIEPALARGLVVIDVTTGSPPEMIALGGRLEGIGVHYLDATVAGSSAQVRARDAIVMAGGDAATLESCRDIFDAFATRVFHVGGCGAGAQMKLVINLTLGLNRAVLAEALAFAEACGVDSALALDVLRASPAYSRAMDVKGAKMLARDYTPEARLKQHHKDVRLILSEAALYGVRLPLSELHDRLLGEAEEAGYAEADNSAIREVYRRKSV